MSHVYIKGIHKKNRKTYGPKEDNPTPPVRSSGKIEYYSKKFCSAPPPNNGKVYSII